MDVFDSLALAGRKYEQQTAPGTSRTRLSLSDVLEMFNWNAILELTPVADGKQLATVKPDPVRKMKVSLLDNGISAIHSSNQDWYEVFKTAPSGDLAKARIVAHAPSGSAIGEIRMLIGRRTYDYYFEEDPIFAALANRQS
jgi:hypothetical protein